MKKQTLKSYHFDLGNSSEGPVGFCARITATTEHAALIRLKALLPDEGLIKAEGLKGGESISVYFNPKAITGEDIDEWEEVESRQ
jgi:hypothetical protein